MEQKLTDAENLTEELLSFFKVLADATRLKIIGLLAQKDYSVVELAEMLNLGPSTVSHHLARLSAVGLVSARAESYFNVYTMEEGALEEMAQRIFSRENLPRVAADVDLNAYDRKIMSIYGNPDGTVKQMPTQLKKREVILRHIVKAFEMGKRYPEKEVNEIIKGYYFDYATIRREMIMSKLMAREGGAGEYWRIDED